METLHNSDFAVTVNREAGFAFHAAVEKAVGIGLFSVALIEQGFARDKSGGEMFDEGGNSRVDKISRHADSMESKKGKGGRVHREAQAATLSRRVRRIYSATAL